MTTPAPKASNAHLVSGSALARANSVEEMEAHDQLPPAVRQALADAVVQWSATNLLLRWRACAEVYGEEAATRRAVREIGAADAALVSGTGGC